MITPYFVIFTVVVFFMSDVKSLESDQLFEKNNNKTPTTIAGTLDKILKNVEEVNKIINNWSPNQGTVLTAISKLQKRVEDIEIIIKSKLLTDSQNVTAAVTQNLNNFSQKLNLDINEAILPKINEQLAVLHNIQIEEQNIQRLIKNVTTSRNNSSQEGCPDAVADANTTTTLPREPSNAAQPDADTSDSRLLHVTVPSSVRARTDVWKHGGIPDKDDLDMYMVNVTGCQYMAHGYGSWQSVSNSTVPARGTWRRRLAVRGERNAGIRVTWDAGHDYIFRIGINSNTETVVYDYIQGTRLLTRATPGVMSQEKYSQFYYIQLEDGVMSFGALGESTPWWRHDVTVSAGDDDVRMWYETASYYGVKLLVCE